MKAPALPSALSGALAATLLGVAWVVPLDRLSGAFPAHMIRHMILVALAAPALVLAAPGLARRLAVPALAGAVVDFAVVWAWHLPVLHGAARGAAVPFMLEQGMFLLAGIAVWAGALGAAQPLAGAGALLLTSMHMTLLGALLSMAPSDVYAAICRTAPDLDGQRLGGLIMLGIGTPAYLVGGLVLTARAIGPDPSEEAA